MQNTTSRAKKRGIMLKPIVAYVFLGILAFLIIILAVLSGANKKYKRNIAQLKTDLSNAYTTEATTLPPQPTAPAGVAYSVHTDGDDLNLRDSASDGEVIATIPAGSIIYITTISGDWGFATYSDKQGWVSMKYVEKVESAAPAVTGESYYTGQ